MNKPRIHNNKKDLCINPPNIVIPKINIPTNFWSARTSTPEFRITRSEANAVTIAKIANGPKGWVNSLWEDATTNKIISAPNKRVKYKTSNGFFIVLDDLNDKLHVGDEIFFEGEKLIIKGIIAPTTPVAKWSIQV